MRPWRQREGTDYDPVAEPASPRGEHGISRPEPCRCWPREGGADRHYPAVRSIGFKLYRVGRFVAWHGDRDRQVGGSTVVIVSTVTACGPHPSRGGGPSRSWQIGHAICSRGRVVPAAWEKCCRGGLRGPRLSIMFVKQADGECETTGDDARYHFVRHRRTNDISGRGLRRTQPTDAHPRAAGGATSANRLGRAEVAEKRAAMVNGAIRADMARRAAPRASDRLVRAGCSRSSHRSSSPRRK